MVKEKNSVGLSREFIIHPGETIAEILEDRDMTQRELAVRTGVTEKHISTVINGQKNISAAFARKLEYALGIETSFWMNLQANYDQELIEFEDVNNISDEEIGVLKKLKEVINVWVSYGWLDAGANPAAMVLDLRGIFGISNLLDTPKIPYATAFRAQYKNNNVDPYVLFAWQKMCEMLTKNIDVADGIDIDRLRNRIPEIKHVMFLRANQIQKKLTAIFSECGIAFKIVPNFTGAPVQGFIKETEKGKIILCMTLRQKFADIFWFTLFHEIAHILNGDARHGFLDFDSVEDHIEDRANSMAGDFLINPKEYRMFLKSEGYKRYIDIEKFAETQNVRPYIVLGRLMKEEYIPYKARPKYDWT
ncbi:MAG: HigA family addiction module antidote protein [Lachnospiraceae bacterium]|nr:HigA family addiction module antidote protein [Lachnospiraceae bacterium]